MQSIRWPTLSTASWNHSIGRCQMIIIAPSMISKLVMRISFSSSGFIRFLDSSLKFWCRCRQIFCSKVYYMPSICIGFKYILVYIYLAPMTSSPLFVILFYYFLPSIEISPNLHEQYLRMYNELWNFFITSTLRSCDINGLSEVSSSIIWLFLHMLFFEWIDEHIIC